MELEDSFSDESKLSILSLGTRPRDPILLLCTPEHRLVGDAMMRSANKVT